MINAVKKLVSVKHEQGRIEDLISIVNNEIASNRETCYIETEFMVCCDYFYVIIKYYNYEYRG